MTTSPPLSTLPAGTTLAPASEAELVEAVRDAAARGQPLFCEGNGSKRHHGPAPLERARRLSVRRLAAVTAHDPADMVVSVQAGARLVDLQRTLAAHKQWLPLDPPYPNATIGGILATASAGPRRLGYGTAKDALLGLRVVTASGEVTKSGGRVVKNVSGFDLHRLQVGAFGSLGVLLEAHFKVSNRPAVKAALVFACASFAEAQARLLAVAASSLRPVALEAVDAAAAAGLRALGAPLPDGAAVAIIGLEGAEAGVERHLRELAPLQATLLQAESSEGLWQAFRDAPTRALDEVTLRVGARPHALPALLQALEALDLGIVARSSQVGSGIARLRLGGGDLAPRAARMLAAQQTARASSGYVIVESAPVGVSGREALPFGVPAGHPLARKIKEAWDPNGLLNPGRVAL
jgi:glycolate oxidase FAD binding subunit